MTAADLGHPVAADVTWLLDAIDDAQARLERTVSDASALRSQSPSRLPGWSVGHVLTHLARHADATSRVVAGASVGERPEQYVGGRAGRAEEIERGAGRPLEVQLADVRASAVRCALVLRHVVPCTWDAELVRDGTPEPLTRVLVSRWREIEIHHLDLGTASSADWPDEFVTYHLPRELGRLPARAPSTAVPPNLDDHEVLAWLVGRGGDGLPALPAWA